VQNPNVEIRNQNQIRMTNKQQALAYREQKRHGAAALQNLADRVVPKKIVLALGLVLAFLHCEAAEVRVFAAASLTDSMKEVASAYEKASGDKVVFNFGASSMLARQIEEGAPADIFFSADEAKMDGLESKGLIEKGTRKNRLSNWLVIVVATENGAAVRSPKDLASANVKRVALGDPRAVPIGVYAREYLEKLKLWEAVRPKVVATENVRAALAAVEAGNADASIVYKTDAAISKKVRVAFEVPLEEGPKIRYPMAIVKDSKAPQAAKKFFGYLSSDEAGRVFKKYGFIVIEAAKGP
jgi:molybdate transport system substrate-binding protein